MKLHDRVRIRGTEETGTIIDIESRREGSFNKILFITVSLDDGNVMVYDISEVTTQPN